MRFLLIATLCFLGLVVNAQEVDGAYEARELKRLLPPRAKELLGMMVVNNIGDLLKCTLSENITIGYFELKEEKFIGPLQGNLSVIRRSRLVESMAVGEMRMSAYSHIDSNQHSVMIFLRETDGGVLIGMDNASIYYGTDVDKDGQSHPLVILMVLFGDHMDIFVKKGLKQSPEYDKLLKDLAHLVSKEGSVGI